MPSPLTPLMSHISATYTVDPEKRVVTHHVEGSLAPDFTDTHQPRPFKLEGDQLEIGDGKTWRRVLERVR